MIVRLLLPALLLAGHAIPQEKKAASGRYLPLEVGAKWVYATNYDVEIEYEVTAKEKVGEVECLVMERRSMGRMIRRLWLAPGKDGIWIHKLQQGRTVMEVKKPFPKIRDILKKDLEWEGDAAAGEKEAHYHWRVQEKEEVKVPAGTFDAWKIRTTSQQGEVHFVEGYEWHAVGVGMVKKELTFYVSNKPMKVVYELKTHPGSK